MNDDDVWTDEYRAGVHRRLAEVRANPAVDHRLAGPPVRVALVCRECGTVVPMPVRDDDTGRPAITVLAKHCVDVHGRAPTRDERTPVPAVSDAEEAL